MAPRVDKKYTEEIEKARKELENVISEDKSVISKGKCARNLLCSAYAHQFSIANQDHDAAESTAKSHNKTIENIHTLHPTITYPDLYQLAGVVAVKALQGPEIKFVPGREDSPISPDESCLSNLKQRPLELINFFGKVQISDPKHIAALYGGLKLATAGDQGENLKFDNSCFKNLNSRTNLSPSDEALLKDENFTAFAEGYAKNKEDFFNDYIEAHKKLSSIGLPPPPSDFTTPRVVGVGVAVAAAVLIFSVFYLINKRRTQHPSHQFQ